MLINQSLIITNNHQKTALVDQNLNFVNTVIESPCKHFNIGAVNRIALSQDGRILPFWKSMKILKVEALLRDACLLKPNGIWAAVSKL